MSDARFQSLPSDEDPVLTDEVVLQLVRNHVPAAKAVRSVDESGHRARTYLVDNDLVLKPQRHAKIRPETSLAKEVFFLNSLHSDARIRVPQVLGYGVDLDTEYTLMSRVPGQAARHLNLKHADRQRILREFGRMLRAIHQLHQAPFVESPWFHGVVRDTNVKAAVADTLADLLTQTGGSPPGWPLNRTPEQIVERLLGGFPERVETVAIHANPGPQHTFVDPARRVLTGVIDFGDARISHPAWDLVAWNAPVDQQAILFGYTADAPASEDFIAVWRTLVAIQMLQWGIRQGAITADRVPDWMHQI